MTSKTFQHFERWWIYICSFHHMNPCLYIASFRSRTHHCTIIILCHPVILENKDSYWASGQRITPRKSIFCWLHCATGKWWIFWRHKRLKSCQRASEWRSAVIRSLLWIAWIYTDGRITMKTGRWDFLKNINPTIIPSHSIPSHVETHAGTASRPFHKQGSHEPTALGEIMCGDMELRGREWESENEKLQEDTGVRGGTRWDSKGKRSEESKPNGKLFWNIYLK